jgi:F0F1-type ATP synthase epsilon subunit
LVLIRKESGAEWINVVVTGGFALVNNDKITILVNEAELGSV